MHEVLFGKSPIVVIQALVPTEITTNNHNVTLYCSNNDC